jgi:hypothetical protein
LPQDTCCHRAALHLKRERNLKFDLIEAANFYAGRHLLEQDPSITDAWLLIPDISEVNPLLSQAPGWRWDDYFSLENPPLVFAKPRSAVSPAFQGRCNSITALRPLLQNDPKFVNSFWSPLLREWHDVGSTFEAAETTAEGGGGYCITNIACAERFHLETLLNLKHMTIVWKLFRFERSKV